jgi:hypothetical protein
MWHTTVTQYLSVHFDTARVYLFTCFFPFLAGFTTAIFGRIFNFLAFIKIVWNEIFHAVDDGHHVVAIGIVRDTGMRHTTSSELFTVVFYGTRI